MHMNLTNCQFEIFDIKGLKLQHTNFEEEKHVFGKPIAVSPSGEYFVFKQEGTLQNNPKKFWSISILKLIKKVSK